MVIIAKGAGDAVEPVEPPVPVKPEPLTASITASFTDSQKARVKAAAAAQGVSMSAYVNAATVAKLDTTGK